MADQDREEEDKANPLLGSGPVLGGGPAGDAPETPSGQDPAPPPIDDHQRRFEEAANVFGSDAFTIKRIDELRATGMPAVLFLGLRTTGKTWLLQRMKYLLNNNYTPKPPLAITEEEVTSDDVQERDQEDQIREFNAAELAADEEARAAGDTSRSSKIIVHRFLAREGSFALIDIPGERVDQFINGNYSALRDFMAALRYASAIIVALPADLSLLCSDADDDMDMESSALLEAIKRENTQLSKFENALLFMASARSLMRHKNIDARWKDANDPEDDYDREITADKVEQHATSPQSDPVGGPDGEDCPTFFALTKADKFFAAVEELPDCAHVGSEQDRKKFERGNKKLCEQEEGRLLKTLYETSSIRRPMSLVGKLWVQITELLRGKKEAPTQLSNPPEMVMQARGSLFNKLTENFPLSRFDLVAAFYGHTGNTLQNADFKRYPATGVSELSEWLSAVHGDGIQLGHIRARRVFAKIYGWKLKRMHIFRARPAHAPGLGFMSPSLLANMFRKEFHLAKGLPLGLFVAASAAMLLGSCSLLESTDKVSDVNGYKGLQKQIGAINNSANVGVELIPALRALPGDEGKKSPALVKDLGGWNPDSNPASYYTPVDMIFSQPDAALPDDFIAWQKEYVCGLKGWGEFRDIVRIAAINGYGNCNWLEKLAMRSPVMDRLQSWWGASGAILGLLVLMLGWAAVIASIFLLFWYQKTRKAYAWLYHSGVATTRRPGKAAGS